MFPITRIIQHVTICAWLIFIKLMLCRVTHIFPSHYFVSSYDQIILHCVGKLPVVYQLICMSWKCMSVVWKLTNFLFLSHAFYLLFKFHFTFPPQFSHHSPTSLASPQAYPPPTSSKSKGSHEKSTKYVTLTWGRDKPLPTALRLSMKSLHREWIIPTS